MTVLRNIKQEKQKYAFAQTNRVIINKSEYKSLVEEMGMMIYNNSLISTMAHLKAKGGAHKDLYNHIKDWYMNTGVTNITKSQFSSFFSSEEFLQQLIKLDSDKLRLVTKETISLMDAFKEMVKVNL